MSAARGSRLVPAAEFTDRTIADEAWVLLTEAGVPSTLEHTPRSLGQGGYTRLYVPTEQRETAQRMLAPLVERDQSA